MNTGVISKRYAKALLALTNETGRGEEVCREALALLENPDMATSGLSDEMQRLTMLLIRNGRLSHIRFVLRSYVDMYRKARGISEVTLTTAVPAPELEDKLRKVLTRPDGGQILFKTKVDPDLIGGFLLEADDKVLDASARRRIEAIRQKLDELNKRIV